MRGTQFLLSERRFHYTRLKALTWRTNGLAFAAQLQANGGRALASLMENAPGDLPIVIDCRGVYKLDEYSLSAVFPDRRAPSRPLVFSNVVSSLSSDLQRNAGNPLDHYHFDTAESLTYGKHQLHADVEAFINTSSELVVELFERIASASVVAPCPMERLASTPLKASGMFDARKIIGDPEYFVWTCLGLADRLEELVEELRLETSSPLLAVSLRASPLAVSVARLLTNVRNVIVVDHLGPRSEIMEEDAVWNYPVGADHIYVGDFIIGGTELKVAETYAACRGGSLRGAIVIGSFLNPDEYGFRVPIRRLVSLRKCGKVTYTFA